MRCRCCNKVLSHTELKRKNKNTGDFEDLCNRCIFYSTDEAYGNDYQYTLQNLTDDVVHYFGVTIHNNS
jgi:hypothetical protein